MLRFPLELSNRLKNRAIAFFFEWGKVAKKQRFCFQFVTMEVRVFEAQLAGDFADRFAVFGQELLGSVDGGQLDVLKECISGVDVLKECISGVKFPAGGNR